MPVCKRHNVFEKSPFFNTLFGHFIRYINRTVSRRTRTLIHSFVLIKIPFRCTNYNKKLFKSLFKNILKQPVSWETYSALKSFCNQCKNALNMNNTFTVSVVIPLKDEAPNIEPLAKELDSVFNRHPWKWECVWVDDGSIDESLPVLNRLHQEDPRHDRPHRRRYPGLFRGRKKRVHHPGHKDRYG